MMFMNNSEQNYGTFAPGSESSIRCLELSLPGTFVPWNSRSLELSLLGAKVTLK